MAKKPLPEDAGSGRIGLVVAGMRHCVHNGYIGLISWALSDCDKVIVSLGPSDYLSSEDRMDMLRAVFGPVLSFICHNDINADEDTDDWVDYILGRIRAHSLPAPTDYYTGSTTDARWYFSTFARLTDSKAVIGNRTTYQGPATGRRLNILDRGDTPWLAGSELGTLIQRRDPEWQAHVPAKLIRMIERRYNPAKRVAIQVENGGPDQLTDVPVGTRAIRLDESPRLVYELKDDGKWRVLHEAKSRLLNPDPAV